MRREYILFAIPLISMIVIGLYQVLDESFKKEFILERRKKQAVASAPKRRYADAVTDGGLRHPESAKSETAEVPVAQTHGA